MADFTKEEVLALAEEFEGNALHAQHEDAVNQFIMIATIARAYAETTRAMPVADGPCLSDEWIAARWPDQDADEIRRRFEALLSKLGDGPWRGMPRYPEAMQPVLAWAAMLPSERIEALTSALALVPDHLREYKWAAEKPAFGEQRVKYEHVVGDNGHGMGRQAVAITPYIKGYNLASWIAAASPGNVGALLAELARLRAAGTFNEGIEAAIVAGWNACRKSIYAVCEDIGNEADRNRADTENPPRHHFGRGEGDAAKRIARAFNSMEARDDDNVTAAIRSLRRPDEGRA